MWRETSKRQQDPVAHLVSGRIGLGEGRSEISNCGVGERRGQLELHRWLGAELSLEEKQIILRTWLARKWGDLPGRVKSKAQGKTCLSGSKPADD